MSPLVRFYLGVCLSPQSLR